MYKWVKIYQCSCDISRMDYELVLKIDQSVIPISVIDLSSAYGV
jgi:hypothetical protein